MDAAELWDPDLPPEWAAELGVGEGEAAAPNAGLGDAGEEEEAAAPAYIQGHISDKFFKRGWRMIEGEPLYHNILTNQVQDSPPYDRCGSNGCILEAPPPRSRPPRLHCAPLLCDRAPPSATSGCAPLSPRPRFPGPPPGPLPNRIDRARPQRAAPQLGDPLPAELGSE